MARDFFQEVYMSNDHSCQGKTLQDRMDEEERLTEKVDQRGNRWGKAYFGGGEHFRYWLAQCKELGEVMVEEADPNGFKCFEEGGESPIGSGPRWVKQETMVSFD